jgi:hypothetical protein
MIAKSKFEILLDIVCIEWGFCGCIKNGKPLSLNDIIPSSGPVCVSQFVDWVFLADDMNPNSDIEKWKTHKEGIRKAFIDLMGCEILDANELRSELL